MVAVRVGSGGGAVKHTDVNMRGVYLHVIGDLLQSLGVALAGLVIWWCALLALGLWSALPRARLQLSSPVRAPAPEHRSSTALLFS